jgi:hypothetical protein
MARMGLGDGEGEVRSLELKEKVGGKVGLEVGENILKILNLPPQDECMHNA